MSITLEQAKVIIEDKDSRPKTLEELRNLINSLDVTGSGNATILYSGGFGNNTSAEGIALALANSDSSIRIVNKTDAAKFLDYKNNPFLLDLFDSFWIGDDADPDKREIKDKNGNIIQEASEANKFLFDVNYGGGLGAWATVSKNFVASPATTGNVRVIAPFADATRVFAEVELKELLNNPNVNQIDGNSNYFNDGTVIGQPVPEGIHSSSATNVIITARGDEKVSVPKNIDPKAHLENSQFANEQLKNYANEFLKIISMRCFPRVF